MIKSRSIALATILLGVVVLTTARSVHAQIGGRIENVVCVPVECHQNVGPTFSGSAETKISGTCSLDNAPLGLGAQVVTNGRCSVPVILETSADSANAEQLVEDGCGGFRTFTLGQLDGHASAIDVLNNLPLYSAGRSVDCAGGETPPPPPFGSC